MSGVLLIKRLWVGKKAFLRKCSSLSRRDARLKLETIRRQNEAYFAKKNRGFFAPLSEEHPSPDRRYREVKSHYFIDPNGERGDETKLTKSVVESVHIESESEGHLNIQPSGLTDSVTAQEAEPVTNTGSTKSQPQATPAPTFELDPENFEWYCAEWCVYLGHRNVRVTRSTKDGGIDVHGDGFIAQVKLQELPVGVKAIRELAGLVSIRSNAIGYFFTVNGYSLQALAEANELGLAIFVVRPFQGEIIPKSEMANLIVEDVILSADG